MPPGAEPAPTSVLFIDTDDHERTYFAEALKRCSPGYLIHEARDGESGLERCQSERIDCVVLELDLADQSGFEVLVNLVPRVGRPSVAVIVLTRLQQPGLWELARRNGALACCLKRHLSVEALDRTIQDAIAFVKMIHKEDRHSTIKSELVSDLSHKKRP